MESHPNLLRHRPNPLISAVEGHTAHPLLRQQPRQLLVAARMVPVMVGGEDGAELDAGSVDGGQGRLGLQIMMLMLRLIEVDRC